MSDLIRKKGNKRLLERKAVTQPEKTYEPADDTANEEKKKSTSESPKPSRREPVKAPGTTTVRVSTHTKNQLSALVTMGASDSVDGVISIMIEEYLNMLTPEEKKGYQLIRDVLMMKK